MDSKKSPKADLENKRMLFVQIGLIVTLAIVLAAFEWKSYDRLLVDLGEREVIDIPEEMIEITRQEPPPPPPPPPPLTVQFQVVEDDVEIEDDFIIDADIDITTEVTAFIPTVLEEEQVVEDEIFMVVEEPPTFPGGEGARIRFLSENIRYPQMARESGIQGIVFVTFVVEPDGSVTNVRILRGIGGGCDEEAIRVLRDMPTWNPGKQRGRPVRVQFNMPIRFTLQ